MAADTKEKFLFDQNIFDEHGNIEGFPEGEDIPVVFSEAELEAAKKDAFERGRAQAAQEATDSREHKLSIVLDTLSKDMRTLFAQETAREKLYEREAVELTRQVFEKLFPYMAEKHGFEELSGALETVLRRHSGKASVQVRVHPASSEGVTDFLRQLQTQNPDIRFEVLGDETLGAAACKLSWDHGGALHDMNAAAEEVLGILKDGLAGSAATGHDKEVVAHEVASIMKADKPVDERRGPEEKLDE
ncbi:MAG: hypothetical protein R3E13_10335 [Alphaproteobacteria bacterium]